MTMPDLIVACYSGHTYAQEPRAFVWQGRRYLVAKIEQRWRTPDGPAFRLWTESGECFELHYDELQEAWAIQSLPHIEREGAKRAKILAFPPPSDRRRSPDRGEEGLGQETSPDERGERLDTSASERQEIFAPRLDDLNTEDKEI
jgi:hypothetical protein